MAGLIHLLFLLFSAGIYAMPRPADDAVPMPCGNKISKENENLCRSFNGGGICEWDSRNAPHCRVGKTPPHPGSFTRKAMSAVAVPTKPENAAIVIQAAKLYSDQTGNSQIKMIAQRREQWMKNGGQFFDNSEFSQCLVNVPVCHRTTCGGHAAQRNASLCLSDPKCCFDHDLYKYQYTFGSEFMAGAPTCYYGATSKVYRKVSDLVKPWNPWYSGAVLDIFKSEIVKPLTHSGMQGCSVADPTQNLCGWEGITEIECRLKDCCYTSYGSCVYPQRNVALLLKSDGSYPEFYTADVGETQCSANPFMSPKIFRRLSCNTITSDPYSVLSCPSDCCLDRKAIYGTLKTRDLIEYYRSQPQPRPNEYQQAEYTDGYFGTSDQSPLASGYSAQHPSYPNPQPTGYSSPFPNMQAMHPDLMNMVSTVMGNNRDGTPGSTTPGESSLQAMLGGQSTSPNMQNMMMQMLMNGQSPNQMNMPSPQDPSGLSGGLLQLYLNNGGYSGPSSGRRSLNPSAQTMMDAYMAGLMNQGKQGASNSQGINPAMMQLLFSMKGKQQGLDIGTLMQLGILPFGLSGDSTKSMNPWVLNALLNKDSDGKKTGMSDALKFAMLQRLGKGGQDGNNMVPTLLMANMMKNGNTAHDSSANNFMMMSMLSNMMNKQRSQSQSHQQNYHTPTDYGYENYPVHAAYRHRQHPNQQNLRQSHTQSAKNLLPTTDRSIVNDILAGRSPDSFQVPCPYRFVKIGKFPDISNSVRGCCKAVACYHMKQLKKKTAPELPMPEYQPWTAWTPCDKTCGLSSFRTRVRTCIKEGRKPNIPCDGPAREFEQCKLGPCIEGDLVPALKPQNNDVTENTVDNNMRGNSFAASTRVNNTGNLDNNPTVTPTASVPKSEKDLDAMLEELLNELDNPSFTPPPPDTTKTSPQPVTTTASYTDNAENTTLPETVENISNEKEFLNFMNAPVAPVTNAKGTWETENAGYREWTEWSMCDRECGGGRKIRMRLCLSTTTTCQGPSEELNDCNTHPCEGSKGVETTEHLKKEEPTSGGSQTTDPVKESPTQNPEADPDNMPVTSNRYVYGAWSQWSQCRNAGPICNGNGLRMRQRRCFLYSDGDITAIPQENCEDSEQTEPCTTICFPTDMSGGLENLMNAVSSNKRSQTAIEIPGGKGNGDGEWTEWTPCKSPCEENNRGIRTRKKVCTSTDDPFCDRVGQVLHAQQMCTAQC